MNKARSSLIDLDAVTSMDIRSELLLRAAHLDSRQVMSLRILHRSVRCSVRCESVIWLLSAPFCLSQGGSKAIFHLEAFVARFMSDYKQYIIASMG